MAGLENRVISPEPDLGPRILFNERLWDVIWATQWRKTSLLCPKCPETPPATSLVEPLIRADSTSSFAWGDRDQNLGRSPTNSSPFPPQASREPGVARLLRGKSRLSAVPQSPPGASHVSVKEKKAIQGHLNQG